MQPYELQRRQDRVQRLMKLVNPPSSPVASAHADLLPLTIIPAFSLLIGADTVDIVNGVADERKRTLSRKKRNLQPVNLGS